MVCLLSCTEVSREGSHLGKSEASQVQTLSDFGISYVQIKTEGGSPCVMLESKLALNCLPCSFQICLGSIVKDAFCVNLMPYSIHNTDMGF